MKRCRTATGQFTSCASRGARASRSKASAARPSLRQLSIAEERWLFGPRSEWGANAVAYLRRDHVFLYIDTKRAKHYFFANDLAAAHEKVEWGLKHNWNGMLILTPGKVNNKTRTLPLPSRLIEQGWGQRTRSSR